MHSTCGTNTLSTNKVLQTLGLCHLPVAESCTRTVTNFIRCFPSVTGKGTNGTNIKQFFTYYLIQRHLILHDWHFWMTRRRKDTKIRQVFNYYLIQRHLMLYDWHFPMTWKSHKVIYPNKYLQGMSTDGWTQVVKLRYGYILVTYCRKTRFSYYSQ